MQRTCYLLVTLSVGISPIPKGIVEKLWKFSINQISDNENNIQEFDNGVRPIVYRPAANRLTKGRKNTSVYNTYNSQPT